MINELAKYKHLLFFPPTDDIQFIHDQLQQVQGLTITMILYLL